MTGLRRFTNPSGSQEKGRAPGGCGQKEINMDTIVQARSAGNGSAPISSGMSEHRKLAIWLDKLVEEAKAKKKPVAQMVSLTPALAQVLLDRNPDNRKISSTTVETYAHDIAGGRWAFNGEPIIVADTGDLNDGQHRAQAVIEAGRPIDVVLLIGVPRDTRTTLDRGKVRTVGDYLAMDGHTYSNVLGAAASLFWSYKNRGVVATGSHSRATKSDALATVREYPGLERSVMLVHEKGADAAGGKSMLAFVHFALCGVSRREDADRFILSVINGAGLKFGDPILYARNRLVNERGKLRAPDKAELLFRAWNAHRKGETGVKRISLLGGVLPVLEA